MSERDDELDRILAPLSQLRANELQLKRWQKISKSGFGSRWAAQIAAAAFIGFAVGFLVFRGQPPAPDAATANNFDSSATIESVYVKNE